MSGLRRTLFGGLESAALRSALVRGAATVSSLGALVAVTRSLGTEDAGLFLLAQGLVAIGATLGLAGMNNLLTRRVAALRAQGLTGANAYRSGLRRAFIGAALTAGLLLVLAPWVAVVIFAKPDLAGPLAVMAPAVIPLALVMVASETLRGLGRPLVSQLVQVVCVPLLAALLVPIAVARAGVNGAGVAYGLSALVAAVLAGLLLARMLPRRSRTEASRPADEAPNAARSMWLLGVMGILGMRTAPLILGMLASVGAVAEFEVSLRVLSLATLVLVAINAVLAPRFAQLSQAGKHAELKQLARRSAHFSCLLLIPFLLVVCWTRPWILAVFGLGEASLGPVFLVLAAGELINITTGPANLLLLMSGNERCVRNLSLLSVLVVVATCFLLIPTLGVLGAACASAAGSATLNVGGVLVVRRTHGFWTLPRPKRRLTLDVAH